MAIRVDHTVSDRHRPAISVGRRRYDSIRDRYNAFVERHERAWELAFAALALLYVAVGFAGENADPGWQPILEPLEFVLTTVFVLEFATRFIAARSRSDYLVRHVIDLVALIPVARGLRLFRLLRLLRLVRAFSGAFRVLGEVERVAAHRGLVGLVVAWAGVTVICSTAFWVVENETNPDITAPTDALWWGVATLTGGDPLADITTPEGRLVAGVLLVVGVALYGAITAVLTAQLLARGQASRSRDDAATTPLRDIPGEIERLGSLWRAGWLTDEEFDQKKAELLARL
jgi:voltage-gated potassium channel